jgi:hypothetical protein
MACAAPRAVPWSDAPDPHLPRRTHRQFGGLVAGQGARWLGTRAANAVRTPERAEQARGEWALKVADELVTQLGQMKGAAMKVGQVLSTVDFDLVPEAERERFKERLAALRDDVPARTSTGAPRRRGGPRSAAGGARSPTSRSRRWRPPRSARSTARGPTTARRRREGPVPRHR